MKDLTEGRERSAIIKFATPMLLGNLFQQTYNIVDRIIVGNLIGDNALGATGASGPIIFALISFVIGIASGATIIIAQYYGAKNYEKVKKAIDTTFIFIFFASLVIMTIGITFSKQIFRLTNLEEEIIPLATIYLNTILLGTVLLFGFNGVSAILRGTGDSKTPLYFLIISSILNIILDYIFIKFFNWGIRGAALATVCAQGTAFFGAAIYLNRTHQIIKIKAIGLIFDRDIFRQSFRIGVPSGFQQTFVAVGMIALYSIVNQFGGDVTTAYAVSASIDALAMLPAMTFGQALGTFVGQNIGAKKIERVKKGLVSTLAMSLMVSITITTLVILFRSELISVFTKSKEIVDIGSGYLIIVSSAYFIFSIMFALNGVLRGAGDTLIPMFITLFSLWIIRIPFAWLLSGKFQEFLLGKGINWNFPTLFSGHLAEKGIWFSVPIAWAIGAICSYFYYRTGNWKKKTVFDHEKL